MVKKIPMRRCVATGERLPKKDLLRIVRTPEGDIKIDLTGKMNGHGAYLKKSLDAVYQAKKNHALDRALEVTISDEVWQEIERRIQA